MILLWVGTARERDDWAKERLMDRREILLASTPETMRGRRGPVKVIWTGNPRYTLNGYELDNLRTARYINARDEESV